MEVSLNTNRQVINPSYSLVASIKKPKNTSPVLLAQASTSQIGTVVNRPVAKLIVRRREREKVER